MTERNLLKLQYMSDFESASNIVKSWLDVKTNNKELNQLSSALVNMYFYVNALELERESFNRVIDNLREDRNKKHFELEALKDELPTKVDNKFNDLTSDDINKRINAGL